MNSITFVVPGNPGDAAINGWKTPIVRGKSRRATMVLSAAYRGWRARAVEAILATPDRPELDEPVHVRVDAYWPRLHRSGQAAGLPLGDVDAVIKASLDALEHAGVIATDALVESVEAWRHHDKGAPRVEITVQWTV
jgi:Holliday junction resolvase RusA-like endonuclease